MEKVQHEAMWPVIVFIADIHPRRQVNEINGPLRLFIMIVSFNIKVSTTIILLHV